MSSLRIATWIAVFAGAVGGGVGAYLAHSADPNPAPFRVAAPPPPDTSAPHARLQQAAVHAAPKPAPPPPTLSYAPPLPLDADAVHRAALHCAWNHVEACLQAGVAYDNGSGVSADTNGARLYLDRARELATEQCQQGQAESCYALAYIYQRGVGVNPEPDKVPPLIARIRLLCRVKATPICRRVVGNGS